MIDPSQGLDGILDVRIKDGRIEALGQDVPVDGAIALDLNGLLVLPGLIDGHVHCFRGLGPSIGPEHVGVTRGVTTVVDAGSAGQSSYSLFRDHVIAPSPTRVLAYLHLSTLGGIVGPSFANLGDPRLVDSEGIAKTIEANRDRIIGIKIHAITSSMGSTGMEPMRRGREIAEQLKLPLMIHIGETWGDGPEKPIQQVIDFLRPGDIITHMYTMQRGGLLDANNRLHPAVQEARARGIRFDVGHGGSNFNFEVAQRLLDMDFPPDTISTDGSYRNLFRLVFDLPTVMSKLLALGLSLTRLVEMVTIRAAELIGRAEELGSLAPGRIADVSVLRLEECEWTAQDSQRQKKKLGQRLVPVLTLRAGEVHYPVAFVRQP